MATASRYHWFKCNHEFFESHKMRFLERTLDFDQKKLAPHEVSNVFSMAMGYVYVKLLAESCTHDGELRLSEKTPYTPETLAKVIGCPIPFFKYVMERLKEVELIDIKKDGTIALPDLPRCMGSESESAERVRKLREKRKNTPQTPQDASEAPKTDNDTVSAPTPQEAVSEAVATTSFSRNNPPSLDKIMKIATSGFQMLGGKSIPKEVVEEWYNLMTATGWVDTKGQDCAKMWRVKLGHYWNEENKKRRADQARQEAEEKQRQEEEDKAFKLNKMLLAEDHDD